VTPAGKGREAASAAPSMPSTALSAMITPSRLKRSPKSVAARRPLWPLPAANAADHAPSPECSQSQLRRWRWTARVTGPVTVKRAPGDAPWAAVNHQGSPVPAHRGPKVKPSTGLCGAGLSRLVMRRSACPMHAR
jgi:hypothetical protein